MDETMSHRCQNTKGYAWSHLDEDELTRFVAALGISPFATAETAVRVQILKNVR